ncbi:MULTISPECIES: flagellar biosynthetic protein FliO [Pseudoalteromonas]|uniref:flagellar biosynthetic protein FliO n=1 Tax=Pseudoalteromonas TaxID=53246 RepID=UPI000FFF1767|nr:MULTISPECIES: flagellar biosynthetic protein FliO [Pseudoalteromonas]MCG9757929.1 flagellar biosynthetic protein FliO [Pseudoalteromonas sp. Isolate6]NKC18159.1 flagellar biosynthetic protein FliO [Pseudoalteromonas galatheae]RXE85331.1 flagellar biosynthetic protein FliO [Pseudoalteromonas sp. A757]
MRWGWHIAVYGIAVHASTATATISEAVSKPSVGAGSSGLSAELLSMGLSLMLVILLILGLAFVLKRLNPNIVNQKDFKVIRSISLGTKERLLVIELDDKQHLLGVTPNNINYLYQLETPLDDVGRTPFANELQKFLAGKGKVANNHNKKNHD